MKTFCLIIFSFYILSILGQERNEILPDLNKVIAVNGLNIREKPNKNSKILGKIPFGEKIKYESNKLFGRDSIKEYKDLFKYDNNNEEDFVFESKWVKIRYKSIVGYILESYLYFDIKYNNDFDNEYTNDYALLYPSISCNPNLKNPFDYNWYGFYKNSDNTYSLKKIKINFFSNYDNGMEVQNFGICAENNKGLKLIIGSKKTMIEGFREYIDLTYNSENILDNKKNQIIKNLGFEFNKKNSLEIEIYLNKDGKKQLLHNKSQNRNLLFEIIEFVGDVDGDGQLDYILGKYGETGQSTLFLSSEAKNNNIVEPVADFKFSYCC